MSKLFSATVGFLFLAVGSSASAITMDDMVGVWTWEGFTVEVAKCEPNGVCAKVTAGPKNLGMEMIRSKPAKQESAFVGQVAHPINGQVYSTRMNMPDADTWHLDGCTNLGICASGDFKRIK